MNLHHTHIELKDNEVKLLEFLLRQVSTITSQQLATELSVSIRSIKNYVSNINQLYPSLIISSHEGYQLRDFMLSSQIVNQHQDNKIPESYEERTNYIFKKLLITHESYLLTDFAQELFVSTDTLINDISKIRKQLIDFDLKLVIRDDQLSVEGPAYNKRKLLNHMINKDSRNSFLSLSIIQEYVPTHDLNRIKQIITRVLTDYYYFIDDFSLLNFILHIAITMERSKSETSLYILEEENKVEINEDIINIIDDIAKQIEIEFNIAFTEDEKYYFALLIMTRVISHSLNQLTLDQLQEVVGEDITKLVNLIQEKIYSLFGINFNNQDFVIRFSLHIKNLMTRLKHDIVLRNLQMREIKNSYPFIYDVSVYVANIIMNETNYSLTEDEISYIALHIGVLIEEQKAMRSRVKTVFIHPRYFFNSFDTVKRCIDYFNDDILVAGIVSSEEDLEQFSDYDLLISTIPLTRAYHARTAEISFSLNQQCITTIQQNIDFILKQRRVTKMKKRLSILFHKELFFPNKTSWTKDDTINKLCDALEDHGYTDDEFRRKIFERESLSPSAYANVAMPHPLEMIALKSTIGVSLHPKGLTWNDNQVNIVFMIATSSEDRLFFKEIFDFISTIIVDTDKVQRLSQINDYDEFISTLVEYFEEIQP